jgi:hypothetical protein
MNFDKAPFFHHRDRLRSIGAVRPSQSETLIAYSPTLLDAP